MGYGTFMGAALALLIFVYYGYFHYLDYAEIVPFIFISALMYFFIIGYYVCHKQCSFKAGLKAGAVSGFITTLFVCVALFAVHNIFFYYETISEPDKLAAFHSSGLLSMKRFMVYYDIRMSLILIIAGTMFATFASGMGSYTASNIRKSESCRNPHMSPS